MISEVSAELPSFSARRRAVVADRDEILGEAYRCNYGQLVGLARLLLDDRGQAEEVVQEAFARTYAGWSRVRDQNDPIGYVRRAVVNLAKGGLRRRSIAQRHPAEAVPDDLSAESTAFAASDRRAVADAVRLLPERQRQCVVLRYFLECSTAETADTLGISDGAVKTHLHRALASLARDLESLR
jgi:RNA polymerase sigma-70 factor (sigma-E family)